MTDQPPPETLIEPDNPAAYALARHIADHPVSTIQAAFRYLNSPLAIELHAEDAAPPQTPASAPEGPQEPRTGPGRQPDHPDTTQAATERLRADANTWRLKAIRRALTASRLRGTIDACIDLVDEPVTDRTAWGDGYRAGIADLREALREFGHLEGGTGAAATEPASNQPPIIGHAAINLRTTANNPPASGDAADNPLRKQLAEAREGEAILGARVNDWAALAKRHQEWGQRRWNAWKSARARARRFRAELAARDAALAAYTAQLVHDQQRLARVRRLADQWQAAMRPGERHPAAAAIHRALEADDDGPSVAECREVDRTWPLEKAGD